MNRDECLKKLTMLDFMCIDLNLYLDTHPTDQDALENFNTVATQASQLREFYEKEFGPLLPSRPTCSDEWRWIDNPWPWDEAFNFKLCREEY